MNRLCTFLCLVLPALLLAGCMTNEPRVHVGIHDPIERHPPSFWGRITGDWD